MVLAWKTNFFLGKKMVLGRKTNVFLGKTKQPIWETMRPISKNVFLLREKMVLGEKPAFSEEKGGFRKENQLS